MRKAQVFAVFVFGVWLWACLLGREYTTAARSAEWPQRGLSFSPGSRSRCQFQRQKWKVPHRLKPCDFSTVCSWGLSKYQSDFDSIIKSWVQFLISFLPLKKKIIQSVLWPQGVFSQNFCGHPYWWWHYCILMRLSYFLWLSCKRISLFLKIVLAIDRFFDVLKVKGLGYPQWYWTLSSFVKCVEDGVSLFDTIWFQASISSEAFKEQPPNFILLTLLHLTCGDSKHKEMFFLV